MIYGKINNGQVRIHYYRTYDNKPTLIFLHGMADYGLCWSRTVFPFINRYDVVLIDARGHGLSDSPQVGYSSIHHAEDVHQVKQSLSIDSPILIGHSMGAAIAIEAAIKFPDDFTGIVLVDPPWRENDQTVNNDSQRQRESVLRSNIASLKIKTSSELFDLCFSKFPNWNKKDAEHWAKAKQLVSLNAVNGYYQSRQPWMSRAKMIKCPTLLICSDPDSGGIVTEKVVQEAATFVDRLESVHINTAGHYIHLDKPAEFAEAVGRFVEKCIKKIKKKRKRWFLSNR